MARQPNASPRHTKTMPQMGCAVKPLGGRRGTQSLAPQIMRLGRLHSLAPHCVSHTSPVLDPALTWPAARDEAALSATLHAPGKCPCHTPRLRLGGVHVELKQLLFGIALSQDLDLHVLETQRREHMGEDLLRGHEHAIEG